MIRVLYVTKAKLSLSRAHNRNILKTAEALAASGKVSVEVFSARGDIKGAAEILAEKNIKPVFRLNANRDNRPIISFIVSHRKNFDIFYYRDPFIFHMALFARFILRKKVVFEAHGSHEWAYRKIIWHMACATGNGLVFITEALRNYYKSRKPSVVTHCNGIEPERFYVSGNVGAVREELKLPADKSIILYAGSFLWHSIDVIAGMLAYLDESSVLAIVGAKEDDAAVIREKAGALGISDRVFIFPRVLSKEVPKYLFAADILVNPLSISYPGSISSKLYEYLAAAKPIISSKGGANEEILKHGENALIVDPMTAEGFAEAAGKLLRDKGLRLKLSENALQSSKLYTWDKRAKRIVELLDCIKIK